MKTKIYIYIGLPRSGKTTLATETLKHTGGVLLDCDKIRAMLVAGTPEKSFRKENEPIVWASFQAMLRTAIVEGVEAIHIANTNCNLSVLQKLITETHQFCNQQNWANDDTEVGVDFLFYILNTDVQLCKQRAENKGQYALLPVIENMKKGHKEVSDWVKENYPDKHREVFGWDY